MAKAPKGSRDVGIQPGVGRGSSSGSGGGKSAQVAAILEQIEEVEVQIAQTRLTDKQNELQHKQTINGKKDNIRQVVEQVWDTKIQVAEANLQVGNSKVEGAQDRVGQEQEITSLNKTLGAERVAKVQRKIYQLHEFDDVD